MIQLRKGWELTPNLKGKIYKFKHNIFKNNLTNRRGVDAEGQHSNAYKPELRQGNGYGPNDDDESPGKPYDGDDGHNAPPREGPKRYKQLTKKSYNIY